MLSVSILPLPLMAYGVRSPVNKRFRLTPFQAALIYLWAHSQAMHVAQVVQEQSLVMKLQAAQRVGTFQRPARRFQMGFQMAP